MGNTIGEFWFRARIVFPSKFFQIFDNFWKILAIFYKILEKNFEILTRKRPWIIL